MLLKSAHKDRSIAWFAGDNNHIFFHCHCPISLPIIDVELCHSGWKGLVGYSVGFIYYIHNENTLLYEQRHIPSPNEPIIADQEVASGDLYVRSKRLASAFSDILSQWPSSWNTESVLGVTCLDQLSVALKSGLTSVVISCQLEHVSQYSSWYSSSLTLTLWCSPCCNRSISAVVCFKMDCCSSVNKFSNVHWLLVNSSMSMTKVIP